MWNCCYKWTQGLPNTSDRRSSVVRHLALQTLPVIDSLWMTDGGDRVVCPLLLGQTGSTLTDTYVSRSSTFAAKCCKNDSFVTLLEFSLCVSPSPTLLLSLGRCLHQVFDTLCCVCWSLGLAWESLWLWVCTSTCILLSYCSFLQQMSHKK